MQTRKLGTQGLIVSSMGLGCMGMSDFYANRDDAESIRTLHLALDRGITFLDTADMYGPFTNEILVGKALRQWSGGNRSQLIIATKFGNVRSEKGEFLGIRGDPAYIKACCDASLQRLNLNHIDLYYQHRVDQKTPIEETVGAMADLVKAGKVKYLGLSEASPATIRRAHKIHPISALQTEYSLWSREPEDEILPTLRELKIGFVPYSPLGRGFLTGQIQKLEDLAPDDWRRNMPRFKGGNFQKNLDLVQKIQQLAGQKKCTPAQLALAWVLAQGDDIVPIPGTKRTKYLEENLAALTVTLTPAELAQIDVAAPKNITAGDRYPTMTTIDR